MLPQLKRLQQMEASSIIGKFLTPEEQVNIPATTLFKLNQAFTNYEVCLTREKEKLKGQSTAFQELLQQWCQVKSQMRLMIDEMSADKNLLQEKCQYLGQELIKQHDQILKGESVGYVQPASAACANELLDADVSSSKAIGLSQTDQNPLNVKSLSNEGVIPEPGVQSDLRPRVEEQKKHGTKYMKPEEGHRPLRLETERFLAETNVSQPHPSPSIQVEHNTSGALSQVDTQENSSYDQSLPGSFVVEPASATTTTSRQQAILTGKIKEHLKSPLGNYKTPEDAIKQLKEKIKEQKYQISYLLKRSTNTGDIENVLKMLELLKKESEKFKALKSALIELFTFWSLEDNASVEIQRSEASLIRYNEGQGQSDPKAGKIPGKQNGYLINISKSLSNIFDLIKETPIDIEKCITTFLKTKGVMKAYPTDIFEEINSYIRQYRADKYVGKVSNIPRIQRGVAHGRDTCEDSQANPQSTTTEVYESSTANASVGMGINQGSQLTQGGWCYNKDLEAENNSLKERISDLLVNYQTVQNQVKCILKEKAELRESTAILNNKCEKLNVERNYLEMERNTLSLEYSKIREKYAQSLTEIAATKEVQKLFEQVQKWESKPRTDTSELTVLNSNQINCDPEFHSFIKRYLLETSKINDNLKSKVEATNHGDRFSSTMKEAIKDIGPLMDELNNRLYQIIQPFTSSENTGFYEKARESGSTIFRMMLQRIENVEDKNEQINDEKQVVMEENERMKKSLAHGAMVIRRLKMLVTLLERLGEQRAHEYDMNTDRGKHRRDSGSRHNNSNKYQNSADFYNSEQRSRTRHNSNRTPPADDTIQQSSVIEKRDPLVNSKKSGIQALKQDISETHPQSASGSTGKQETADKSNSDSLPLQNEKVIERGRSNTSLSQEPNREEGIRTQGQVDEKKNSTSGLSGAGYGQNSLYSARSTDERPHDGDGAK